MALSLSKSITVCAFFSKLFESNNGILSFTISLILHFLSGVTSGNITLSSDLTFLPSANLNTVSEGNDSVCLHHPLKYLLIVCVCVCVYRLTILI